MPPTAKDMAVDGSGTGITSNVTRLIAETLLVPVNCHWATVKLWPVGLTMSNTAMSGVPSRVRSDEKTVPVVGE